MFTIVKHFSLSPISGAYSKQSAQMMRIFDVWQHTTIPQVVITAFRATGFVPIECDGDIYLQINLSNAIRIRDWVEMPHREDVMGITDLNWVCLIENKE
jgi:hypothetical protein